MPAAIAAGILAGGRDAYLLLLLPLDFFSPPWLLRLLLEPPLLEALAFSLLLPEEPLFLLLPDLPDEDDDFELPDFMVHISFGLVARTNRATTGPL